MLLDNENNMKAVTGVNRGLVNVGISRTTPWKVATPIQTQEYIGALCVSKGK